MERHLAHVDALNERAAQVDNLLQEKKEMIKRKEELEKEFEVARVDAEVRGKEQRCVLRRLMLRRRSSRPRPTHARTLARSHALDLTGASHVLQGGTRGRDCAAPARNRLEQGGAGEEGPRVGGREGEGARPAQPVRCIDWLLDRLIELDVRSNTLTLTLTRLLRFALCSSPLARLATDISKVVP